MGWAPAGRVQCGATRLVRLLLGPTSVSPHKLECGNPLVILGVRITLSKNGMQFTPDPQKVARWTQQIDAALAAGRLCAGESSKLAGASRGAQSVAVLCMLAWAGRLMWVSTFAFKKVGRSLLYPLFKQQRARCSRLSLDLQRALEWWRTALGGERCELRAWSPIASKTMHMLCDARSVPPRVAAVLIGNGLIMYSDMQPPEEVRCAV